MDIRLHRAEERRLMRGFVLSLMALLGAVMLVALLMWWANLWLAKASSQVSTAIPRAAAARSADPAESA